MRAAHCASARRHQRVCASPRRRSGKISTGAQVVLGRVRFLQYASFVEYKRHSARFLVVPGNQGTYVGYEILRSRGDRRVGIDCDPVANARRRHRGGFAKGGHDLSISGSADLKGSRLLFGHLDTGCRASAEQKNRQQPDYAAHLDTPQQNIVSRPGITSRQRSATSSLSRPVGKDFRYFPQSIRTKPELPVNQWWRGGLSTTRGCPRRGRDDASDIARELPLAPRTRLS